MPGIGRPPSAVPYLKEAEGDHGRQWEALGREPRRHAPRWIDPGQSLGFYRANVGNQQPRKQRGATAARPHQTEGYYDQLNEKNEEVTHWRRIEIKPEYSSQDVTTISASVP